MTEIEPGMLAAFDQEYADAKAYLGDLIVGFRELRVSDAADGVPESVSIVGMCTALIDQLPVESLANALAVAIVEMSRRG